MLLHTFSHEVATPYRRMWGRVRAWCLSWWQRNPLGTAWSKQVAPQRGQAQGPLIPSTPPLAPTGPWAASTSMDRIPRFGRQNSSGEHSEQDAGDHQGPPSHSPPPSPLQNLIGQILRAWAGWCTISKERKPEP